MNGERGTQDDFAGMLSQADALQLQGRYLEAIVAYGEALILVPKSAVAHNNNGVACMALGQLGEAAMHFRQALAAKPDYAEAHNNLGVALKRQGEGEQALACYVRALEINPRYAKALLNVGTYFFERQDYPEALSWYGESLRFEPEQVEANQNVALILEKLGRHEEAAFHRRIAFGQQSVFIDLSPRQERTVLVLWGAGVGNIPIDHLLPVDTTTRIVWIIEHGDTTEPLPDYDLVFNAIGDPDVLGPVEDKLHDFVGRCQHRLFNAPTAVVGTRRDLLPNLLEDEAVVVPPTRRMPRDQVAEALQQLEATVFPILLRPTSSHGGDHLHKVDVKPVEQDMALWNAEFYYVTGYQDYRSVDGHYRKYRFIFIDRKPYPYHLAIGNDWMVHYETAGMLQDEWKRQEERDFLASPVDAIGERAHAALERIGRALNLDYAGIDFSVLADGRVLVFEANATMLVHPEDEAGVLAYKNPYVRNILDAFNAMLTTGVTPLSQR
jgi:tetratricopeptide (TPR) repeat protein